MTFQGWILILGFVAILLALTKPVGAWLFALYEGRRTPLHIVLGPVERGFYTLAGIDGSCATLLAADGVTKTTQCLGANRPLAAPQ